MRLYRDSDTGDIIICEKNPRQHFSRAPPPRKLRIGQNAVVYHLVFSQKEPEKENETRDNGYFSVDKNEPDAVARTWYTGSCCKKRLSSK